MTTQNKIATLQAHHIECRWRGDGRLMAEEVFVMPDSSVTTQWVDATDWTPSQLYAWLGY